MPNKVTSLQDLISLFDKSTQALQPQEDTYKEIVHKDYAAENALCELESKKQDVKIKEEDLKIKQQRTKKREELSKWLLWVSVGWLVFSGIVIVLIGCGLLCFGEISVATFIVGSLAEVFGLWKIALQYFFSDK